MMTVMTDPDAFQIHSYAAVSSGAFAADLPPCRPPGAVTDAACAQLLKGSLAPWGSTATL